MAPQQLPPRHIANKGLHILVILLQPCFQDSANEAAVDAAYFEIIARINLFGPKLFYIDYKFSTPSNALSVLNDIASNIMRARESR